MDELLRYVDRAERLLDQRGVTTKHRAGTSVRIRPGGPMSKRYKRSVVSTEIIIMRNTTSWQLIHVERIDLWPTSTETFATTVTRAAMEDIARAAFKGITVDGSAEVARDVAVFGRGCHVAYARVNASEAYNAVQTDARIVDGRVCISRLGQVNKEMHFALYSKDRTALDAAMAMARLAHGERLAFEQVREPE